ncbi:MAG: serine/threonine-protein phosphatase, partial [Spirochaetaceae bacterium]|nr:serine/threonine-protein phosphatase [Spirochaetaceae bacterium]
LAVPAAYPPLGIEEKSGAKKGFILPLKQKLRIALFSDGLLDMKNPQGAAYGMDRCLNLLKDLHGSVSLDDAVEAEIRRWCGRVPPADDITVGEIRIGLPQLADGQPPKTS